MIEPCLNFLNISPMSVQVSEYIGLQYVWKNSLKFLATQVVLPLLVVGKHASKVKLGSHDVDSHVIDMSQFFENLYRISPNKRA